MSGSWNLEEEEETQALAPDETASRQDDTTFSARLSDTTWTNFIKVSLGVDDSPLYDRIVQHGRLTPFLVTITDCFDPPSATPRNMPPAEASRQ